MCSLVIRRCANGVNLTCHIGRPAMAPDQLHWILRPSPILWVPRNSRRISVTDHRYNRRSPVGFFGSQNFLHGPLLPERISQFQPSANGQSNIKQKQDPVALHQTAWLHQNACLAQRTKGHEPASSSRLQWPSSLSLHHDPLYFDTRPGL